MSQQTLNQALALHQQGRLQDAERLYQSILRQQPAHTDALHYLGLCYAQQGKLDQGIASVSKSLAINEDDAIVWNNRGNMLFNLGDDVAARADFSRAIALQPNYPEAHSNLGNVLQRQKQFTEAIAAYRQAIQIEPRFAQAHNNCGIALQAMGQIEEALAAYAAALAVDPQYAEAHYNRGMLFQQLQRLDDAIASFERVAALEPNHPDIASLLSAAYNNRGVDHNARRRYSAALLDYDQALAFGSPNASLLTNRANTLRHLKDVAGALAGYQAAIRLEPTFSSAYWNRGLLFEEHFDFEHAAQDFELAVKNPPAHPISFAIYINAKMMLCDWSYLDTVIADIPPRIQSNIETPPSFYLLSLFDALSLQRVAAEHWTTKNFPLDQTLGPIQTISPGSKIRIAYLSADFREHAAAYNFVGFLESLDRTQFETFGVCLSPESDSPMQARLKRAFDHFLFVDQETDLAITQRLRELQIDIAVDLMGPTRNSRTQVFALRAAPIQINQFSWASGAEYMDYIIADPVTMPAHFQHGYTEKLATLPHTLFATDNTRPIADRTPSRESMGLPNDGLVFCCFNNLYKITPEVFAAWMEIMRAVPRSVLWLRELNPVMANNLRASAQTHGIAPERLVFAGRVASMDDHLARHRLADLFLDTFPFTAQTTASDALWAGLPVVTRMGESPMSRIAGSMLTALGMPELVTEDMVSYRQLILTLAHDASQRRALRERLQAARYSEKLFNTTLYTRHMEQLYLKMVQRLRAGLPPDHLAVE